MVGVLEGIARQPPFPVLGIDSDNDSAFINETLVQHCANPESSSTVPGLTARTAKYGLSRKTVSLPGDSPDTSGSRAGSPDS